MTESAADHRLQGKSFRSPLKAYTERLLAESGRVTVISLWGGLFAKQSFAWLKVGRAREVPPSQ
jgi:hypothetical protein